MELMWMLTHHRKQHQNSEATHIIINIERTYTYILYYTLLRIMVLCERAHASARILGSLWGRALRIASAKSQGLSHEQRAPASTLLLSHNSV